MQSEYSLWSRDPEEDVLSTCRELGIGFIAYSPLGRGFLTGQIKRFEDLAADDYRRMQPRFQGEVSFQGDDRFGTGSGVTGTDIGLRLRYEIRREFAPYIGVSWLRGYGETARIARREGEAGDAFAVVFGLRLWW